MADGVKEEELRSGRCLHKHDDAASDDCEKPDDVHDTDAVENNVAWPGQRF